MNNLILKVGEEYIKTEADLEKMHCATDENGKELSGLRLCRWLFNYVIESKKKIAELQDKLDKWQYDGLQMKTKEIELQDRLHRRNMQIKELKKRVGELNTQCVYAYNELKHPHPNPENKELTIEGLEKVIK